MLRSWLRQNGHYSQLQINLKNIFICRCKLFWVFFICPKYSQAHIIKLTSMWSFHPQNFCLQLLGSVRIWRHINISRLCSSCHPSSGIFGFSCYLFVFALNVFTSWHVKQVNHTPFSEIYFAKPTEQPRLVTFSVNRTVGSAELGKMACLMRMKGHKNAARLPNEKTPKTIHFKIQDGYQAKNKSKVILFRLQFRKNSKYPLFRFAVWLPNTLRRNPPGHWVILVCSGQKSCTRII